MALRNREGNANAAAPAPAARFESEDGAAVATAERPTFVVNDDALPTAEVKAATTTALAQVGARALAVVGTPGKVTKALDELENLLPADEAEALVRVKSGSGDLKDANGFKYGSYIDIELVSFHKQWLVSPGSKDDESGEKVRFSYDGVTTTKGENVVAYLDALKAEGLDKASVKVYTILVGVILGAAKDGGEVGNMVTVSLSPTSRQTFDAYRLQTPVKQRMGKLPLDLNLSQVRVTAESKSSSKNDDYTKLNVDLIPTA